MFTIKFEGTDGDSFEVTRETIERAQQYAKSWMDLWNKTVVYLTQCPSLKLFEASQFEILKETL